MSFKSFGEATGRTTHRQVYWVTPAAMPGPFKCWSIKVVDTVLRGENRGRVRVKHKTCRTLDEAKSYIAKRMRIVP